MQAVETDHYKVLGVHPESTVDEIRQAYRRLARTHHPDLNPNPRDDQKSPSNHDMVRINEAWRVLSDPDSRQHFDRGFGRGIRLDPQPPPAAPGHRRREWVSGIQAQIVRLGRQAGRSATQTLLLGTPLGSRGSYEAVVDSVVAGLSEDTEARVRAARAAGAAPLDLGVAATLIGIRSLGDRLRRQASLGVHSDMVMAANLLDRMWDILAYELPSPLPQRLGGNPGASATVHF